jgi:hypothetical protein
MNRLTGLLVVVLLAGCRAQVVHPGSSASLPAPAGATDSAPVFVSAICTLMGNPTRSEVPAGHPVIVVWGWSAATQEQVEEYIQAGVVAVTFDGRELTGVQQDGIPYDSSAKVYKAVWAADVGNPAKGVHVIDYSLTFTRQIFDGISYYGPGTKNERQEDRCEIEVK